MNSKNEIPKEINIEVENSKKNKKAKELATLQRAKRFRLLSLVTLALTIFICVNFTFNFAGIGFYILAVIHILSWIVFAIAQFIIEADHQRKIYIGPWDEVE